MICNLGCLSSFSCKNVVFEANASTNEFAPHILSLICKMPHNSLEVA